MANASPKPPQTGHDKAIWPAVLRILLRKMRRTEKAFPEPAQLEAMHIAVRESFDAPDPYNTSLITDHVTSNQEAFSVQYMIRVFEDQARLKTSTVDACSFQVASRLRGSINRVLNSRSQDRIKDERLYSLDLDPPYLSDLRVSQAATAARPRRLDLERCHSFVDRESSAAT